MALSFPDSIVGVDPDVSGDSAGPVKGGDAWTCESECVRTSDWLHYALRTSAAPSKPSSSIETSRILNFWTFPVTVMGNSSVMRT